MSTRMSKAEVAEAAASLFRDLITGDDANEVADVMGWDEDQLATIRKAMLVSKAEEIRAKSTDHVYVEYIIEQRRNIHDLTDLIKNLDQKSQYNAVVGSIRLRADLTDKILERGFDLGILKRAEQGGGGLGQGNTFNIIGGVDVNVMTAPQLREAITTQLGELHSYMEKFGDGKNILELAAGPLHYGAKAPPPEAVVSRVVEDDSKEKSKKSKKKRPSDK